MSKFGCLPGIITHSLIRLSLNAANCICSIEYLDEIPIPEYTEKTNVPGGLHSVYNSLPLPDV